MQYVLISWRPTKMYRKKKILADYLLFQTLVMSNSLFVCLCIKRDEFCHPVLFGVLLIGKLINTPDGS